MLLHYFVVAQRDSRCPDSGKSMSYDSPNISPRTDAHVQARDILLSLIAPSMDDNPSSGRFLLTGSANLHQTGGLRSLWPSITEILPIDLMYGLSHRWN